MNPGDITEKRGLRLLVSTDTEGSCNDCIALTDLKLCSEFTECSKKNNEYIYLIFKPVIDHEPTHDRLAHLLLTGQLDWVRTNTNVAFEHPAAQSPSGAEPRDASS